MGKGIFEKIIYEHLVNGNCEANNEISIKIDQTLTQDSLGVMAYLQFESMNKKKIETELSVSYVDHLMLQLGQGNCDVHRYLETVADKFGIIYSKAGNGICHQVHLERFSRPGKTLVGSDSHTVMCGSMGMASFGVGGLDVALAMGGQPFYFLYPRIVNVILEGKLQNWSTAKDVILEILRKVSTKGNKEAVFEYSGEGLNYLTVTQRATIANMGTEAGATTSIFPSDEITKIFLRSQNRENEWLPLYPDSDALYDNTIVINLSAIQPNVALPHSPDSVVPVKDIKNLKINQVLIGSIKI